MSNISLLITAALFCAYTTANAQNDKKEKVPVYNYTIDDPMDAFGSQPQSTISPLILPEFYSYKPIKIKDTLLKYECYDLHNDILDIDTVRNIDAIKYISLFKSYPDPVHTYFDATGKELPLPISSIIFRYDKAGADKWLSVNYANNKYKTLKEVRSDIVRYDTVLIKNPATGVAGSVVHKYYKVVESK